MERDAVLRLAGTGNPAGSIIPAKLERNSHEPADRKRCRRDDVFREPANLAASLRHPGSLQHPKVQAAVDEAFAGLKLHGKAVGYLTTIEAGVKLGVDAGMDLVAISTDATIIARGTAELIPRVRI